MGEESDKVDQYSHSSVNNRPPHYPHTEYALEQARWLASSHFALPNDRRLLATYEFEKIIRESEEDAIPERRLRHGHAQ